MEYIPAHPLNIGRERKLSDIKYLVIHYTGNKHDTAVANCNYYRTNVVKTSAHYFVDKTGSYQSVPPSITAYAVGGKKYTSCANTGGGKFHSLCNNSNSVSIEICCDGDKDYYPSPAGFKIAAKLVTELKEWLNIPETKVIRHFDVTGKVCPAWAVECSNKNAASDIWKKFLNEVNEMEYEQFKKFADRYFKEREARPAGGWAIQYLNWGIENKIINDGSKPDGYVTKSEAITMLNRLEKLIHE